MKKLELQISAEALSDLEKIWFYTFQKWSKEQADSYYAILIENIEFLRSNFYVGKSAAYIKPGYRVSFVKSHLVFYKSNDDHKLEIIRILHQSVDIAQWLG